MCFSPEQKEKLDEGNALVLVFYLGDENNYQTRGAFLTPAGVMDNQACGDMMADLIAGLRADYLEAANDLSTEKDEAPDIDFIEQPNESREKQVITSEDVGKLEDIL